LNAIFDIYEGRGETEVLDFQTLYRHLEKKGVMDNEIKNLLDELEKIETPNLALLISYIDILRIRNGERRLINIADEITEFVERRGPQKVEDISQFSVKMSEELQKIAIERLHKKLVPSEVVVKDIIRDIYEKEAFMDFLSNHLHLLIKHFLV